MTVDPLDLSSVEACPWGIQVPTGLSMPIQGVHLRMKAIVFRGPSNSHNVHFVITLRLRSTWKWSKVTIIHTSDNIRDVFLFFLFLQVDFCNFGNVRQWQPPGHSIHRLLSHRHRELPDLVTPLIFCCWRIDRAKLVLLHLGLIQQRKGGVRNFQKDVCAFLK